MTLLEKYKFFLTLPGQGEERVHPCNDKLEYSEEPFGDECFFRLSLNTNLDFDDKDLFARLWEIEKSECLCKVAELRIEERGCDGEYSELLRGKIPFVQGDWDPEFCKVSFKVRVEDEYTCMLNSWQDERNYLDIQERVTLKTVEGEIICEDIIGNFPWPEPQSFSLEMTYALAQSQPPPGAGWTRRKVEIIGQGRWVTTWCRQCTSTPFDTSEWTLEEGLYYKELEVLNASQIENGTENIILDYTTEGAIKLSTFFDFYIGGCFDNIISNFFNINPDGTAPDNYEYSQAASDYSNIVLFQSSDIVTPEGTGADNIDNSNQVAGTLSFKQFWENLRTLLDLCMWFDKKAGALRIEHSSYRGQNNQAKVLDLTSTQFKDCLRGKSNYSTSDIDIPFREEFEYSTKNGSPQFDIETITYDRNCSDGNDDTNIKRYPVAGFNNDFGAIYNNPDLQLEESQLDNLTIVSLKGQVIQSRKGVINGPFAMSYIVSKYHLRNRPACEGILGSTLVTFLGLKAKKKMPPIDIILKSPFFHQFEPLDDKVKTYLGECEVESMTRTIPTDDLSLSLKF